MRWVALFAVGFALGWFLTDLAVGHQGGWASHSSYAAGGPADARVQARCSTHRCRHKVYWDRKYRELSDADKGWLFRTRMCESHGNYRTNTGNGYYGAYQYSPPTAWSAGFRDTGGHLLYPHRVYPREQDVRTVWWRNRAGRSQWPVCG